MDSMRPLYRFAGLALVCASFTSIAFSASTAPTTHPTTAGRTLKIWLANAFDHLSAAPDRDDPIMGMFILVEYYGEAGDADGVRKVLAYLEAHKADLWRVERGPLEDPKFCRLATACLRVKDPDAYKRSLELLKSTLPARRNADLVWRDLAHVYGMGGLADDAITTAQRIQEKSWISEGLFWASYAADRNGYKAEAGKLRQAAEEAAQEHPDPYHHGTRPLEARLVSDGNFQPVKDMLQNADWYQKSNGLSEVAREQYFRGDKEGYRQTISEAMAVARDVTDNEPRMRSAMWTEIARSQWWAGEWENAKVSLAEAKDALASAKPFDHYNGLFYIAGWQARVGDTAGALELLAEAEQIVKDNGANLDSETFFASEYRYVFLGLTDAGDVDTATRLLGKIKGLEADAELNAAFAAGFARAGRADEAAATLKKVPRYSDEDQPKGFMGALASTVLRAESASQYDREVAVRRTAFYLAQAGKWQQLPQWVDALPTEGDRGEAALGIAEFLLRGRFADYEPP
jgi:hypothetical protein